MATFMIYDPIVQSSKIKQVNENGRRHYVCNGVRLPSVTTVLDKTADKTAIEEWRNRVGEKEAKKIMNHSKNRGTKFHKLVEDHIKGEELSNGINLPHVKSMYKQAIQKLEKNAQRIYALEIPMFTLNAGVSGTCDIVAEWNGKRSIIDLKGSKTPKKEEWIDDYKIQETIYSMMWNELYGKEYGYIDQIVTLISIDPTYTPNPKSQVFVDSSKNYIRKSISRIREFYTLEG